QSAFWVGLLYDDAALAAAEALVRRQTWQDTVALRAAVPRRGLDARLDTPAGSRDLRGLARDALAVARDGLRARRRLDASGHDETIHLAPLEEIVGGGATQAEHWLAKYHGEWRENVRPIFAVAAV